MWTCWICNVLGCGKHKGDDRPASDNAVPLEIVENAVVEPPKVSGAAKSEDIGDDSQEVKRTPSDPSQFVHHAACDATVEVLEVEEVEFTKTPSVRRFSEKILARQDQIVKVDVHSGAGSEDGQEHEYEDIYLAQTEEARDSGKHSRTESTSSNNSTNMPSQQQLHSPESGVSSASPSDLGHSEEENDKMKLAELVKPVEEDEQLNNNLQSNDTSKYNTINSNSTMTNKSSMVINNLGTINLSFNNNNNNTSTINRNAVNNPTVRSNNSTTSKNYSTGSVVSLVEEVAKLEVVEVNDLPARNGDIIKSNTLNAKSESNKVMHFVDELNRCNTINGPLTDVKIGAHQELNRASSVEFYGNKEINRRPSTTSVESYGIRTLKKSSLNGSVEVITQNLYGVKESGEEIYGSKDKLPQNMFIKENGRSTMSKSTEHIYEVAENHLIKDNNIYKEVNGQNTFNNKEQNCLIVNSTVKEQNLQNSLYNGKETNGQNIYGGKELSKANGLTRSLNDINATNSIYVAPSLDSGIDDGDKLTPSDLDDNKLRLSLPNQSNTDANENSRALKRVVSEPANMCPVPPPPPPPPNEEPLSLPANIPAPPEEPPTPATFPPTGVTPSEGTLAPHTLKKQMVLPFIPPKFGNSNDSNSLIKPSEYLRSISGSSENSSCGGATPTVPVPPPAPPAPQAPAPPPPPPQPQDSPPKQPQPLSTISIHDLNSVKLRSTITKQPAYKTMSCPPKSLTGVSDQPYQAQKQDLIAELKMSKDIPGIKKLKVERVKMEERQDKETHSELVRQYSVENFVEQMPEKDSAGNPIPPWKRQMLAKKAAEKARKQMEEQMAKEAEEKRLQAIPPWKRHLLAQRKQDDKFPSPVPTASAPEEKKTLVEIEVKAEDIPENKENSQPEIVNKTEVNLKDNEDENAQIIPWRAQLRKTNSTLNLLE